MGRSIIQSRLFCVTQAGRHKALGMRSVNVTVNMDSAFIAGSVAWTLATEQVWEERETISHTLR